VYGSNVEITAVSEIYEVCVSINLVIEGHFIDPPIVVGRVVTDSNASLLVSGETDNDHYDAFLLAEEKIRWVFFYGICVL
jgi:hypothetical protein